MNTTRAETATVSLLLALVAAIVLGPHIRDGGFYIDDWSNASYRAFAEPPAIVDTARTIWDVLESRPLLALALATPHVLFGLNPALHLALAAFLAVLLSLLLHAVLRTLGWPLVHAAAVAALVLLFPWSDSTRLWATAGVNQLAVCAYLGGLLLAFRAISRPGSAALHAASIGLYLASVLLYEIAAAAIVASGVLYQRFGETRATRARWALDLVFVGTATLYAAAHTRRVGAADAGDLAEYVPRFARSIASVIGRAAVPVGPPELGVAALVLVLAIGAALAWSADPQIDERTELRRWVSIAAAAVPAIALAYVMFVPAAYWDATWPGLMNRVNLLGALPIVVLVHSAVMTAATLAAPKRRRTRVLLASTAVVLLALGYARLVTQDAARYREAAQRQEEVLLRLREATPKPPSGSTVYTFGHVNQVAPNVPVFSTTWDLRSAARLLWDDPTLMAYPTYRGTMFRCRLQRLEPAAPWPPYDLGGFGLDREHGAAYGHAVFVDVAAGTSVRIRSRAQCRRARRDFRPGPFLASEELTARQPADPLGRAARPRRPQPRHARRPRV